MGLFSDIGNGISQVIGSWTSGAGNILNTALSGVNTLAENPAVLNAGLAAAGMPPGLISSLPQNSVPPKSGALGMKKDSKSTVDNPWYKRWYTYVGGVFGLVILIVLVRSALGKRR